VIRRLVLVALAAGIAAGDDDAARAALRRADPLARGRARRAMEGALIDAALAVDGGRLGAAHVQRVAALAIARVAVADPGDPVAVTAAYAALPIATPPRLPWWSIIGALAALAIIGGVAAFIATRPGPPPRSYVRPMAPPSAVAFRDGGTPLHEPALDRVFGDQLTALVVAAGQARDGGGAIDKLIAAMREPPALAARGEAAAAWRELLNAYQQALVLAQGGGGDGRASSELREAARVATAKLADAGLGYFFEGRLRDGYPLLQAYKVEEVGFVVTDGARRRVLSLRRLDRLNTSYALLGMQSDELGDPVVLLDQIEDHVATELLPVLAPGAPDRLGDAAWLASEEGKALSATVGAVVAGELRAALGPDADAAGKIGALLVERRELVDGWRDQLDRRGLVIARTDGLFLPEGLVDNLADAVPTYQRRRAEAIEDELAALEAPRIASRLAELLTATVRRHEAQHGFDWDRATALRYPAVVEDVLGPPHDEAGDEPPIVRSVRAELSAYLSQLANDPVTPHGALWKLAYDALASDRWGTGEAYVAGIVLDGLARRLAAPGEALPRSLRRAALVRLIPRLAATPGPALRAAAVGLWQELYGEPVTTIVDAPQSR
jgi:hypothetical protein